MFESSLLFTPNKQWQILLVPLPKYICFLSLLWHPWTNPPSSDMGCRRVSPELTTSTHVLVQSIPYIAVRIILNANQVISLTYLNSPLHAKFRFLPMAQDTLYHLSFICFSYFLLHPQLCPTHTGFPFCVSSASGFPHLTLWHLHVLFPLFEPSSPRLSHAPKVKCSVKCSRTSHMESQLLLPHMVSYHFIFLLVLITVWKHLVCIFIYFCFFVVCFSH